METLLHLLLLIIIANGAPVFMNYVFADWCAWPVDFNLTLADGKPVFGQSKTWRGLLASVIATAICAYLLSYDLETGILVAVYSMSGDLISSFIKRRMNMPPSSMAPFLDQVPESLLPALMLMNVFKLDFLSVILLVLLFIIAELLLSKLLYKWGVRRRPY